MKNIQLALFFLSAFSISLKAQTNTFPTSGDAGVGTTTPQYGKIHINGTGSNEGINLWTNSGEMTSRIWINNQSKTFHLSKGADATKGITINNNGLIGIGTTNPLYKLELSTGSSTHALFKGSFTGIQGIQVERDGGDNIRLVTNYLGYGGGLESSSALRFSVNGNNINTPSLYINNAGNVGIGTTAPDAKLAVKGDIHAQEVKVDLNGAMAPDYVFKEGYHLRTLEETQDYIEEHGHLPNIPSAKEMEENGVKLGTMNMKLLEKIEELTLYTLEQEEKLKKEREFNQKQEKRLKIIEALLNNR